MFYTAYLTFLHTRSIHLRICVFKFLFDCPEKLTSPSTVRVHLLSDFFQCSFLCFCSLSSSFSAASVVKYFNRFLFFIYPIYLSDSVHTMLGREIRVQFTYFVRDFFTVHVAESGRLHCSVQNVPISTFQSAEILFDSVRGLFQSVIRQ